MPRQTYLKPFKITLRKPTDNVLADLVSALSKKFPTRYVVGGCGIWIGNTKSAVSNNGDYYSSVPTGKPNQYQISR